MKTVDSYKKFQYGERNCPQAVWVGLTLWQFLQGAISPDSVKFLSNQVVFRTVFPPLIFPL